MSGTPFDSGGVSQPAERFFQFSLLGLLASGYFAVTGSGYLDPVTVAATGGAIALRVLIVFGLIRLPRSDRWITGITVIYIAFYPADYFVVSQDFLTATVHLVLFLAAVKITTAKTDRDYLYVIVIAFLELLAASLLSTNLNYFLFLALFLFSAIASFASWEIRRSEEQSRVVWRGSRLALNWRLTGLVAGICAGVLLFTGALFFVLPRTAQAAFRRLVPERYHITAFSNEVGLGEIGEVKRQDTVFLHARIANQEGLVHLKWRGMALGDFDGKTWSNKDTSAEALTLRGGLVRLADDKQRRRPGRRLNYEVQLRPFGSGTLFIAGRPEFIRIDSAMTRQVSSDSYNVRYRSSPTLRYGVYSYLESRWDEGADEADLPARERDRYLALPRIDPRIGVLSQHLIGRFSDPLRQATAIEHHLRESYAYTIELPDEEAADPLAHFLFERREGHCEYFASAMAVMLRQAGIPSRIATGFQSGVYNPISGWHVIRASDAHSWVEAHIPRRGWVTFDPTPADTSNTGPGWYSQVTMIIDAADTFWQQWVIDYDLGRQLSLVAQMERSRRRFSFDWATGIGVKWKRWKAELGRWWNEHGAAATTGLALGAILLLISPQLRRWWKGKAQEIRAQRGAAVASDATALYLRGLDLLARRGYEKPVWYTPVEFTRVVPDGEVRSALIEFTDAYQALRFGGESGAAERLLQSMSKIEASLGR